MVLPVWFPFAARDEVIHRRRRVPRGSIFGLAENGVS
jgi:hypothetical protein